MGFNIFEKTKQVIFKSTVRVVKPVFQMIKKHPAGIVAGIIGAGIIADDIYQHSVNSKQKKESEEYAKKTVDALKKHEAEIQAMKVEADKAHDSEIINEQLCDVIRKQKEEAESEEVHEDRAADK